MGPSTHALLDPIAAEERPLGLMSHSGFFKGPLTMPRLVTPVCNRSGFRLSTPCGCHTLTARACWPSVLSADTPLSLCLRRSLSLSLSLLLYLSLSNLYLYMPTLSCCSSTLDTPYNLQSPIISTRCLCLLPKVAVKSQTFRLGVPYGIQVDW